MTDPQRPLNPNSSASLYQQLDLDFALQAAGLGVWELDPTSGQLHWDKRCQTLFGIDQRNYIPYQEAIRYIHPEDVSRVDQAVRLALEANSSGVYDETYRTLGVDDGLLRWVRFWGRAYFTPAGEVYRFAGIAQDVTQQVELRSQVIHQLEQQVQGRAVELEALNEELRVASEEQALADQQLALSEARFQSMVQQAPVAMLVLRGQPLTFEIVNEAMLTLLGRDASIVGQPVLTALPELATQPIWPLVNEVYQTGEPYVAEELLVQFVKQGQLTEGYYSFSYIPLREGGKTVGILQVAVDVTKQVVARQKIEESEARFRSLIEEAPVATCLLVGPEHRIDVANQPMLGFWGKGQTVLGKPLAVALPELAGQPFLAILDQVFSTGNEFTARNARAELEVDGVLSTYYFDYTYKPLRDRAGQVYAIMDMAVDVTPQVVAGQALAEKSQDLELAIAIADLGSFKIDLTTQQATCSSQVMHWFGFAEPHQSMSEISARVLAADQSYVLEGLARSVAGENQGYHDLTYRIVSPSDGQLRHLHSTGQVIWAQGIPISITGIIEDVTLEVTSRQALEASEYRYRQLAQNLDQQVQLRTEELGAVNEELTATNEELLAANEDIRTANEALETANIDLVRSNQNLEQFAYIASHDLQEPLRKIQQFGDLLHSQYKEPLGEGGSQYLERMQVAARRMSVLIRDLLAFSRIATSQVVAKPVALAALMDQVRETLSVVIEESKAVMVVDSLPVVQGDASQLEQLFQNLVSNALKFRRRTATGEQVAPRVTIQSRLLAKGDLSAALAGLRVADYYHVIELADNGIGFEEKYLDRIFQVFQRLHGKNEFAGTGIGLAIVQKVITNHGGVITARSKPGEGATFRVYLPA